MAVTLACVAVATACSADDAMSGASGDRAESRAAEPAETTVPGQTQVGSGRDEGGSGTEQTGGGSGKDESGSVEKAPADDRQLLTYTASLDVRVKDVAAKSREADRIVEKTGGYVEQQGEYGEQPEARTVTTRFRVPSAEYRKVLGLLAKLGTKVSASQRTENVTEAVADVDARVKSANASLSRLRALMGRAEDVTDVLAMENAISQRQAELESLKARQRTLTKQVSHATINLDLVGPKRTVGADEGGFLSGLRAGWHGLGVFVNGSLTVLGTFVPFLLVVVPLGAVAYVLVRRRRRPRTPEHPEEDAASA